MPISCKSTERRSIFFERKQMKEWSEIKMIGINHLYGKIKTTDTVTPTIQIAYELDAICATAKSYEYLAVASVYRRSKP